ncbi:MAG TPA: hypothetical protein VMY39_06360, partial [Planctomycetota bacterium]|nr:hypothetical protein [Planctomycetota bacterium]
NPYFGDVRLRDAAIRSGDFLAASSDETGGLSYDQSGYIITGHVDQWLWHAWLEAWLLLADELDAERSSRWRQRIHAGARTLTAQLETWNALTGPFHTRSFETSPNHAVTRAGFLYRAGIVFNEPAWCARVDAFMSRYLALQDADGCWPEYEGPVITYAMVSLTGIGEYFEYTGSEEARRAIERSIPFLARTHYPDGGPITLFDGRQQHTSGGTPWAQFALSLTDEGRALCDLLTRTALKETRYGHGALYRLVENYVHYHEGPLGELPLASERFTHRFRRSAGMRREGPWTWALSAVVTPKFEQNPWSMDRQSLVSLYHVSAGRILNGANCKEHPEAATFVTPGNPADHVPICTSLDDAVTHIDAVYQWFRVMLTVGPTSATRFDVCARVVHNYRGQKVLFKLQPAVHHGVTVRVDGKDLELGDEDWSVEGVRSLSWDRVVMTFDAPVRVWWPFRGYNSYAGDHTYPDLSSARLIVETELDPERLSTSVHVEISA